MIQLSETTEFNTIIGTNLDYKILATDALTGLRALPSESVHCVVTSIPYWGLRSYEIQPISFSDGWHGHLGLEPTLKLFVDHIVEIFLEIKRVMHTSATCWLNIGNSYANAAKSNPTDKERAKNRLRAIQKGYSQVPPVKWDRSANTVNATDKLKPKDMTGQHWAVAFALRDAGFYLRSEIIWEKINCLPSSVTDRPCTSHETIFLLTKQPRYYYDRIAIQEPIKESTLCRNNRAVSKKNKYIGGAPGQQAQGLSQQRAKKKEELRAIQPEAKRNKRTVWPISNKPFKGAHFATFPIEVPLTCLQAGVSQIGCCYICLEPWLRKVEATERYKKYLGKSLHNHELDLLCGMQSQKRKDVKSINSQYETVCWKPNCNHYDDYYSSLPRTKNKIKKYRQDKMNSWFIRVKNNYQLTDVEIIRPVVLDPFLGSGTTIIAALQLNCKAIGIELSSSYAQMAYKRIEEYKQENKTNAIREINKKKKHTNFQLSLFD